MTRRPGTLLNSAPSLVSTRDGLDRHVRDVPRTIHRARQGTTYPSGTVSSPGAAIATPAQRS